MATQVTPIANFALLKKLGGFLHVDGDFRSFIQLSVVVAELKIQLQMMARDKLENESVWMYIPHVEKGRKRLIRCNIIILSS